MTTDICFRLGKKIRAVRKKHGMSQVELAFKAETTRQHISAVEKGTREVGIRSMERIAKALNTPLWEFFQD